MDISPIFCFLNKNLTSKVDSTYLNHTPKDDLFNLYHAQIESLK